MAKEVVRVAKILVNSVDLSDHCSSVTLEDSADEVETTAFGAGYRSKVQGLKDASITATFQTDHATGSVADTMQPLYDSGGTFAVKVWPVGSGTIVYTLSPAQLFNKPLWGGAIGDLATVDVTFSNAGTAGITRGTA
jgi:hypothetical protein